MNLILLALTFAIGVGTGLLLLRAKRISIFPASDGNKRAGVPISLKVAVKLKKNYWDENPSPETEAVVHEFAKLKAYIQKVEDYFGGTTPPTGCDKLGVAIYFGRSFNDGHYLLKKKTKEKAHLLYPNYTAFLMPVFYAETSEKEIDFKYVDEEKLNPKVKERVKLLHKVCSPVDKVKDDKFIDEEFWASEAGVQFIKFLQDPEGFDLGHTKP